MTEGFNNFEQGILLACALAVTGSVFWATLGINSASLRTIEIANSLRRIAEALEQIVKIKNGDAA